jgi:hypothetical protein
MLSIAIILRNPQKILLILQPHAASRRLFECLSFHKLQMQKRRESKRTLASEKIWLLISALFLISAIVSLLRLSSGLYVALGLTLAGVISMVISASLRDSRQQNRRTINSQAQADQRNYESAEREQLATT